MTKFSEKLLVIFTLTVIGFVGFLVPASAVDTSAPEWVKNNAMWWAEGKISEQEYLNSVEFLIEKEIIMISDSSQSSTSPTSIDRNTLFETVKEMGPSIISPFSKNIVPESDRAVGYVVRISNGDLTETHTFDTFGRFEPGEDPVFIDSFVLKDFLHIFCWNLYLAKTK